MFARIAPQEKVDFTKNLAVMLRTGVTINEALSSLADQAESERFGRIIRGVKKEVEMGTPLSEALAKEKEIFGGVFINLLKAGEKSGTLEENLDFLAEWFERDYDLRQEIRTTLLYPKFVLTATLLLGGLLAVYVLPKLVPLFEQLRVKLPLATRLLLAFSVFIEKFWFLALVAIIGVVIGFISLNRLRPIRKMIHAFYIHMPFFSNLVIDYQLALVSQLFSTLLKSGLPLNEALEIISEAATNITYRESLEIMKERISRGISLSQAMNDYPGLYPRNFTSIVATGEKSGTLDISFKYLAEFYSKIVKNKTKKLPTTLEPTLLVFIALMVGFVALSIIIPIYELTRGLSQ
ncbi:hypothetical protein COU12_01700 [Candidatus Jorgensenbacteria bacterium CG10_big_fil_rev_8_21_14_0_10_54_38]|uniref:Type II secretion system protein GspF domain-containing protein n=2 Tax=Candidatus Joergenseniibacteriota TaxID=1752739 RepID=A0A2M6WFW7_9BACT|nr:MAG: hypothetical protein COX26_00385 [Candidatus Jorgensenbacteria bacterium CG23_combo_of_CG06-09_8_20_14_all_54_14]PIT91693.1 MAG: hypothetical protein COU12_01700 [Candidatus Jorgensenbacteria bacterium CG10_big_fil_rev_8_21_14_0_10_54_38]